MSSGVERVGVYALIKPEEVPSHLTAGSTPC